MVKFSSSAHSMAERKTTTPKKTQKVNEYDSWDETVRREVEEHLTDTDRLEGFYKRVLADYVKDHDHSYKKAFRDIDNHDKLIQAHDRKLQRLQESCAPTLRYLAELATGSKPTDIPNEQSIREVFGLLSTALVGADDYIGVEINGKIKSESLQRAALAHSGSPELAEAYCSMSPGQPFLRRYRLSARIQR